MCTYIIFYSLLVVLWSTINNILHKFFTFCIHFGLLYYTGS